MKGTRRRIAIKVYTSIRRLLCGFLVLGGLLLSGCSGQAEETAMGTETAAEEQKTSAEQTTGMAEDRVAVADLQSEKEALFAEKEGQVLGLQYYQGDVMQIRMVDKTVWAWNEDGSKELLFGPAADIYLDRTDGSSELLFADLSEVPFAEEWYMAQDGSIYRVKRDYEKNIHFLIKCDRQGAVLYERQLEMKVSDFCQLADGTFVLLLDDGGGINSRLRVGELNQDTGEVTELTNVQLDMEDCYIGAGAEGLLILGRKTGIQEVNIRDGSKEPRIAFTDTSYQLDREMENGWLRDLRMTGDGEAELLWADNRQCVRETLGWKQQDKIPVVMRGFHFNNGWIKSAVAAFNRDNDTYVITLEEAPDDWDAFATQTSVQIASGGGPDLLYGEVLTDYIQGMIDKGGFENLTPYLEKSGVREEDYFPLAFSSWRQGENIYGIMASVFVYSYSMDSAVLGGSHEEPDIGTLVDALLDYDEKAMYMYPCGAGDILEMFLEGSENLWGMVDWGQGDGTNGRKESCGSCNFRGELFAKMLEAAKRYAYDENQEYPILASEDSGDDLYSFMAPSMKEKLGRVSVGAMFDDGCHPWVNSAYQILAVNANSSRKEGAWEFIAYLLGEEGQEEILKNGGNPVNRNAFQKMVEADLEKRREEEPIEVGTAHLIKGKYVYEWRDVYKEDITEEWMEAFLKAVEDARPLPIRTKPILAIIREEAEDYFKGMKGMEEVIGVIENRVQLYLDENAVR